MLRNAERRSRARKSEMRGGNGWAHRTGGEDQKDLEIPTDTSREVDASSGDPGDALRRT